GRIIDRLPVARPCRVAVGDLSESEARAGSTRQIEDPYIPNSLRAGENHHGEAVAIGRKRWSEIAINPGNGAGLLPVPVKPKQAPPSRCLPGLIYQLSRLRCGEQRSGGCSVDGHMLCDGYWVAGQFDAARVKGLRHECLVAHEQEVARGVDGHRLAFRERFRLQRPQFTHMQLVLLASPGTSRPE